MLDPVVERSWQNQSAAASSTALSKKQVFATPAQPLVFHQKVGFVNY
jgi:hypothetical protein